MVDKNHHYCTGCEKLPSCPSCNDSVVLGAKNARRINITKYFECHSLFANRQAREPLSSKKARELFGDAASQF